MRVVALIPAKAQSRRLPGKNMKQLAGLPLFMHGVRVALEAVEIDHVYVSSDSPEILALAARDSVGGLLRPTELCVDAATNFQVMRHHLSEWRKTGQEPDILVLLQPTTPFRSSQVLDAIIRRFVADTQADSAITVAPAGRVRGYLEAGYWVPEFQATTTSGRMQAHGNLHEATGHAILLRPRRTLDQGSLLGERIMAEPLSCDWADIDIDTAPDWDLAQAYALAVLEKIT
jgi:CMP-N,N'-diacetyllegionaminic acid synthase